MKPRRATALIHDDEYADTFVRVPVAMMMVMLDKLVVFVVLVIPALIIMAIGVGQRAAGTYSNE